MRQEKTSPSWLSDCGQRSQLTILALTGTESMWPPLSGLQDLKPTNQKTSLSYSLRRMRLYTEKKQRGARARLKDPVWAESICNRTILEAPASCRLGHRRKRGWLAWNSAELVAE